MEQQEYICESCGAEFTCKAINSDIIELTEIEFCPFCGEELIDWNNDYDEMYDPFLDDKYDYDDTKLESDPQGSSYED
tara:strand:+ start:28 stop:261 length:234 start_codon:yes stop_codon:yes gene_type:complete